MTTKQDSFQFRPIGFIRTTMRSKFAAPHQPNDPDSQVGTIELCGGNNFEAALEDLVGFDRIWLIWCFHLNKHWRPKVLPPRGPAVKRGVFATRSPHRPNPIGISCVELLSINGRELQIGPCDLLDGTPILDIKPYIPNLDSYPTSACGWTNTLTDSQEGIEASYHIELTPLAEEQVSWLRENWQINFLDRARRILSKDPTPHRSRRIVELPDGQCRMGCGAWRIFFTVAGNTVLLHRITPGYPEERLADADVKDAEAQQAFLSLWQAAG